MDSKLIYDRIPFTYLIGWTHLNMWYYGSRYSKGCHPNDLWVTYFTSSKYVEQFIQKHGQPDVVQVRKIFTSISKARRLETRVLRRFINTGKFLNKGVGGETFVCTHHTNETRTKMSVSHFNKSIQKLGYNNMDEVRDVIEPYITLYTSLNKIRSKTRVPKQLVIKLFPIVITKEYQTKSFSLTNRGKSRLKSGTKWAYNPSTGECMLMETIPKGWINHNKYTRGPVN